MMRLGVRLWGRDGGQTPSVPLRLQIVLRWLAVAGQLAAVFLVEFGLGYPMPLTAVLLVIGLSALLNIYLQTRFPPNQLLQPGPTVTYLAYDLLQLAMLLYLTGGLVNPFALLFLAPVTISASMLTARSTAQLVVLASALVTGLLFFYLPLPWDGAAPDLPAIYQLGIWAALIVALVFIPAYVWRVSREARRMSAALSATRDVLAREQRLTALDGLAAAAAHQLGTPLGTIVLIAKELQNRTDLPAGLQDDANLLREQAERCRDILSSLSMEDEGDPVLSNLSLRDFLQEALLEAGPSDKQVHVSCFADGLLATGEPRVESRPELIYGLGNIIENAAEFAAAHVWVEARYSAQQIIIDVCDDGPGFRPEILRRLGQPYNTSRPVHVPSEPHNGADAEPTFGLGLGFFIANTLLQRTGATVTASNLAPPRQFGALKAAGAQVRLVWPRQRLQAKPR